MAKFLICFITIAVVLGISWALCAGLIWCVCWCFGWEFSLAIATGAWIIMLILKNIFSGGK